jgi:hypothetical protein
VGQATVERAAKFAQRVGDLARHMGVDMKWTILSEQVAFTPRLGAHSAPEPAAVGDGFRRGERPRAADVLGGAGGRARRASRRPVRLSVWKS